MRDARLRASESVSTMWYAPLFHSLSAVFATADDDGQKDGGRHVGATFHGLHATLSHTLTLSHVNRYGLWAPGKSRKSCHLYQEVHGKVSGGDMDHVLTMRSR